MERLLSGVRVLSKWFVLLVDQIIISWSFAVAYFIIKQFSIAEIVKGSFLIYVGVYGVISASIFFLMRIHTGIIRYSNTHDILRIFIAVLTVTFSFFILLNFVFSAAFKHDLPDIQAALFLNFFISSSLLVMVRIGVKSLFIFVKSNNVSSSNKECILIYGSDQSSLLLKQALEATNDGTFSVIGFVDYNNHQVNKYLEQKKVFHLKDIERLKSKYKISKLVVTSEDLKNEGKKKAIERCVELGVKVLTVPPANEWLYGKLRITQIKELKIEDLLQREPITIQTTNILTALSGKRVLVTGAAGSIGSEIVRQIISYYPQQIILCDQAESPLHELQLEIEDNFPEVKKAIFIGDIQNISRMKFLFEEFRPEVVFHAAAYKHVPMMEGHPGEAILTNVLGTKNIADLSVDFDVDKFIMISTDKAVNPTNVMGASKRVAEIYIQSLNEFAQQQRYSDTDIEIKTKFITTRFGNVLGSNGSVIPRFKAQIEKGGPITVTHPDITRYFMTIPEAVQLVLEAGAMGNGGEVFIFDMGQPVKISQLAEKMIKLSGFTPHEDIQIVYTGLRPGEKLFEELLLVDEEDIPTHHEKIKISKVSSYPFEKVIYDINELISLPKGRAEGEMVKKLKEIVPEYKSKNSKFSFLDLVQN